jgi:ATP-dependent RNA helicase HelY
VPDDGGRRPPRARSEDADDADIARLRAEIRRHPCHGCDQREDHARWAERYYRLLRETEGLERRVEARTNTIARTFDRVCGLLESLGYLDGDQVTASGAQLGRLYTELDLLAAECVRAGVWSALEPAELAAAVAALAYESRQRDEAVAPQVPSGRVRDALAETVRLWAALDLAEKDHGLAFLREPDLGFSWAAYRWASGARLESVLGESDLPAGDFVRWTKQLIDLLGQIAQAAGERDPQLRATADAAVDALRRGVVAYSSVG